MSLKGFHIVFIVFATIVTVIFGVWALQYHAYSQNTGHLVTAVGSLILAAALIIYGVLVAKKLKTDW